jgi:hypothetical protein
MPSAVGDAVEEVLVAQADRVESENKRDRKSG